MVDKRYTLTYAERVAYIENNKRNRPPCPHNPDGHCMVSYDSRGIKQCIDCGYEEQIYTGIH